MAVYDWLSNDMGQEAELLRDGTVQCGALCHADTAGDTWLRKLWSWGCRCGAWDDGGYPTRWQARQTYREHKKLCPLKMGLTWNPAAEKWEKPESD